MGIRTYWQRLRNALRGRGTSSRRSKEPSSTRKQRCCLLELEPLESRLVPYNTTTPWGTNTISYSFSNFLDGALRRSDPPPGAPPYFNPGDLVTLAQEAMGTWSSAAAIAFYAQTDSGPAPSDSTYPRRNHPTIRWGHHHMNGAEVAHAYAPGGDGRDGDIHFRRGRPFDLNEALEIAAHEVGHALGMLRSNVRMAIMHTSGNNLWSYSGLGTAYLLPDDIDGIRSLYGPGLGYVLDYNGVMHVYGTRGDDLFLIRTVGNDIEVTNNGVGTMRRTMNGVRELCVHGQDGNDSFQVAPNTDLPVTLSGDRGDDFFRVLGGLRRNVVVRGGTGGGTGRDHVVVDINGLSATQGEEYITIGNGTLYYNSLNETERYTISGDDRSTLTIIDTPGLLLLGVSDIGTVNIQRMNNPFVVTRPRNVLIGGGAGTGGVTGSVRISSRGRVGLTIDDSFGTTARRFVIQEGGVGRYVVIV